MRSTHLNIHVSRHELTGSTYISWSIIQGNGQPDDTVFVEKCSDRHELMWEDFDAAGVRSRVLKAIQRWADVVAVADELPI